MSTFGGRSRIKAALNRLPPPVRDRVGGFLFPRYESYLAATQALKSSVETSHGLPVPPPRLRVAVVGYGSADGFLDSGLRHKRIIEDALARAEVELEPGNQILDWGCGCGRITRWWADQPEIGVHGCDYNSDLVQWVDENLPFVAARTNDLEPPLPYRDGSFDLVYGISIFTHLTDDLARAWAREIRRVLVPGGHFFFTTHGRSFRDRLDADDAAAFDSGESVVRFASVEGSNLCSAHHPAGWIRSNLLEGFDLCDLTEAHLLPPAEQEVLSQDRWLVRRTTSPAK